jgi:hypothetical protein
MHKFKFEKLGRLIQMNPKMLSQNLIMQQKNSYIHPQLNKHKKNWLHNFYVKI